MHMPEMSAIDLLAALKERSILMPVIVTTGRGNVSLAVELMKQGAFDLFEKPFDPDALIASIRSALWRGNGEIQKPQ